MKNNPNTSVKLFDLDQDISETTDISAQYPDTALKMLNLMELSHERSDRFNFKYEDGCSKVTIAISQNGVPVKMPSCLFQNKETEYPGQMGR